MDLFGDHPLRLVLSWLLVSFGVIAVGVAVLQFRRARKLALAAAASGVGAFLLSAILVPDPNPGYDATELARVEAWRAAIVEPAFKRFQIAHPDSVPEHFEVLSVGALETRYGPVRYRRVLGASGDAHYVLSIGDYGRNGFAAWWDSRDPSSGWYLDM